MAGYAVTDGEISGDKLIERSRQRLVEIICSRKDVRSERSNLAVCLGVEPNEVEDEDFYMIEMMQRAIVDADTDAYLYVMDVLDND